MARYENEDVSGLDLPDPENKTCNDIVCNNLICAREVYNSNTRMTTYHVLCAGGLMFDPYNIDIRYKTRNQWKLRRVRKSTFDLYQKFISTRHKTFLHQAEREI